MNEKTTVKGWTPYDEFRKNVEFYFSEMLAAPAAKPHWIFFSLSHRCTFHCRMCGVVNILQGCELKGERVKECLDEIAGWKNNPTVLFTGGEPFLREDIFEIIAHSTGLGLTTEVVSNGSLITPERAARIVGSGLFNIAISIDGSNETTHDSVREKGAFRKALAALKLLSDEKRRQGRGPQISSWVTIMKENVRELSDIIPVVRGCGVECLVYHPVIVSQDDMQNTSPDAPFWLGPAEVEILKEQIEKLVAYRERHGLIAFLHDPRLWINYFENSLTKAHWKCNPYVFMNIGPDGNVRSCGEAFGNISSMSLGQLIASPEADRARGKMMLCGKACLQTCWARPEADSLEACVKDLVLALRGNPEKKRLLEDALRLIEGYENMVKERKKADA